MGIGSCLDFNFLSCKARSTRWRSLQGIAESYFILIRLFLESFPLDCTPTVNLGCFTLMAFISCSSLLWLQFFLCSCYEQGEMVHVCLHLSHGLATKVFDGSRVALALASTCCTILLLEESCSKAHFACAFPLSDLVQCRRHRVQRVPTNHSAESML